MYAMTIMCEYVCIYSLSLNCEHSFRSHRAHQSTRATFNIHIHGAMQVQVCFICKFRVQTKPYMSTKNKVTIKINECLSRSVYVIYVATGSMCMLFCINRCTHNYVSRPHVDRYGSIHSSRRKFCHRNLQYLRIARWGRRVLSSMID